MIKLIVDSTAYIDDAFAVQNDIRVVPLGIIVGNEEFTEAPEQFRRVFEEIEKTKKMATTSRPSSAALSDCFERIVRDGDEAIFLTISSTLSGTYSGAVSALEGTEGGKERITVIDSGMCGQNIYEMVKLALADIKEGKSRGEIIRHLYEIKAHCTILFTPESLVYLRRGGRIGLIKMALGTIAKIKPIFNFTDGTLTTPKRTLGMNKAVSEIVAAIPSGAKVIYVIRIAESEFYAPLLNKVRERFSAAAIYEGELGPVIGAHVGPAVGVSYLTVL